MRSPICLPFLSSSTMLGLPAAATKVGNQSSPEIDRVLHLARRDSAGPTDDHRGAEAAFHPGSLASGERGLTAIGPGEVLGTVVGGKGDDGVVVEAIVLQVLHDRADDIVELRHAGFLIRTSRSQVCAASRTSPTDA